MGISDSWIPGAAEAEAEAAPRQGCVLEKLAN